MLCALSWYFITSNPFYIPEQRRIGSDGTLGAELREYPGANTTLTFLRAFVPSVSEQSLHYTLAEMHTSRPVGDEGSECGFLVTVAAASSAAEEAFHGLWGAVVSGPR
jgi:hypothetical protein